MTLTDEQKQDLDLNETMNVIRNSLIHFSNHLEEKTSDVKNESLKNIPQIMLDEIQELKERIREVSEIMALTSYSDRVNNMSEYYVPIIKSALLQYREDFDASLEMIKNYHISKNRKITKESELLDRLNTHFS